MLNEERFERAIGVVYRLIHIDETRALEPLETSSYWHDGEVPDTYPFAV